MTFNYKHSLFSHFIILKARRIKIWKGHVYKGDKKKKKKYYFKKSRA